MPRTVSFHEPLACEPAAVFRTQREMKLGFITLHDVSPIQLHAVVFGLRVGRRAVRRLPRVGDQARVRGEGLRLADPGPRRRHGSRGLRVHHGALRLRLPQDVHRRARGLARARGGGRAAPRGRQEVIGGGDMLTRSGSHFILPRRDRASRGIHNGFFSLRGTSPHTVLVDDLASDNILQGCMWAWKIPQARDYTISVCGSVVFAEEETLSSSSSPALASTSSEGQHSRSLLLR